MSDLNDKYSNDDPDVVAVTPSQPVATVVRSLTLVDVIADTDLKSEACFVSENGAGDDGGAAPNAAVADDRADISDGSAMLRQLDIGFMK